MTIIHKRQMLFVFSDRGLTKLAFLHDHQYLKTKEGMQHSYACRGEKWRKDLGPLQDKLVIDKSNQHHIDGWLMPTRSAMRMIVGYSTVG